MEKLVRDHIPELMRSQGLKPDVRYAAASERLAWLLQKLAEEADELMREPCIAECADVYEVLVAISGELGLTIQDVHKAAEIKKDERGGFSKTCILKYEK